MHDYFPDDLLSPDEDTEEMEPREYRPLPPEPDLLFPDWEEDLSEVEMKLRLLVLFPTKRIAS